jgi:hypothetical protein
MIALLYFGDFIDGELELGVSFCKTMPIKNTDLVFINSSQTYHKSLVFLGDHVNLEKDLKMQNFLFLHIYQEI